MALATPAVQTAYAALKIARSYLNDETGAKWPDAKLFPLLRVAQSELSAKLAANGAAFVRTQTIAIQVPAITQIIWGGVGSNFPANLSITNTNPSVVSSVSYPFTAQDTGIGLTLISGTNVIPGTYEIESVSGGLATLGQDVMTGAGIGDISGVRDYQTPTILPGLPANIIFPISMQEKASTDPVDFYIPMQQLNFLPLVSPVEELIYWAWLGQQIQIVGASANNDVILRYRASLTIPQTVNDSLGFIFAENYLGPRIAGLATSNQDFNAQAEINIDTVIRMNIVGNQGVGTRRGAYRRGGLRRIF